MVINTKEAGMWDLDCWKIRVLYHTGNIYKASYLYHHVQFSLMFQIDIKLTHSEVKHMETAA